MVEPGYAPVPKSARKAHFNTEVRSVMRSWRDAICTYLRNGARRPLQSGASNDLFAGSQEALEISARVLLDVGTPVWLEEPGYWLTRRVLDLGGLVG